MVEINREPESCDPSDSNDLLDAYRLFFALTNLSMKLDVLKAMEDHGTGGAAQKLRRDFGKDYAKGLKRAFEI